MCSSDLIPEPVIDITNAHISPATCNLKRLSDIVNAILSMVILSPVFAAIAIAVKLDSKGPAIYRQNRIGRHKKPFFIYKFRTMRQDAEDNGPALSAKNDPRITKIGYFLRKYRLDELPQFWNVLKGDMSFVGPRPEREYYISQIIERVPAYSLIHQIRPGITSWGMVTHHSSTSRMSSTSGRSSSFTPCWSSSALSFANSSRKVSWLPHSCCARL